MKFSRTRLGSRKGLLRCPADEDPLYMFITGPKSGQRATVEEKRRADAGLGRGATRSGGAGAVDEQSAPMVEAVSYRGSVVLAGVKLSGIRRPYCQILISEYGHGHDAPGDISFDPALVARTDRPPMRRHYGGANPNGNGTNWLFADLHAAWHSGSAARSQLYCCWVMASYPRWGPAPDTPAGVASLESLCGTLPTSRRQ